MSRSEIFVRLAARFPQLIVKDVELVVKAILDGMGEALAKGNRIENCGFGRFGLICTPRETG